MLPIEDMWYNTAYDDVLNGVIYANIIYHHQTKVNFSSLFLSHKMHFVCKFAH